MRISIFPEDPGYRQNLQGVKVFFNGYECRSVFIADEELRMIEAAVLDEQGQMTIDLAQSTFLSEVLYGDVRIELPDDRQKPPDVLQASACVLQPAIAPA